MNDITKELIVNYEIRECVPHCYEGSTVTRTYLTEFGLQPGQIHVWDDEGELKIVSGFSIVHICTSFRANRRPAPIPIYEEHIIRHHFADIVEAQYWRACHLMARPHLRTIHRCKAAVNMKPVFQEIGLRRMSEGGQGGCTDDEAWDTMTKLEQTFRVSRKTIGKFIYVMTYGNHNIRYAMSEEEITVTEAYKKVKAIRERPPRGWTPSNPEPSAAEAEIKSLERAADGATTAAIPVLWHIVDAGPAFVSLVNDSFSVGAILPVITDTETQSMSFVTFSEPIALKNQYEVCGKGESVEDVVARVLEAHNA